jgi:uncharacterized protein YdaU (DUF1376 family)
MDMRVSTDSLAMMPWFEGNFLKATLGWTFVQRSLYRCLLCASWELGPLLPDEAELARIAGATSEEFAAGWPRVKSKFVLIDGGLVNEKLEQLRADAINRRDKKRRAGKAGGEASGQARAKQPFDSASSKHEAKTNPTSTSTSTSNKEKKDTTAAAQPLDAPPAEFLELQRVFPKRSGAQPWHRAFKACRARLKDGDTWADIVDGAKRYAIWVRHEGIENTPSVLQAATFCGPDKLFRQKYLLGVHSNGTGKRGHEPRPSAIERVKRAGAAALDRLGGDDDAPNESLVVVG